MSNEPSSHHDVLRELGGAMQVSRYLREFDEFVHIEALKLESRVLGWSTRNNIPGPYWHYVERIAANKGRSDITTGVLAKLCLSKRNKSANQAEGVACT